jgi:hypothetical protein
MIAAVNLARLSERDEPSELCGRGVPLDRVDASDAELGLRETDRRQVARDGGAELVEVDEPGRSITAGETRWPSRFLPVA